MIIFLGIDPHGKLEASINCPSFNEEVVKISTAEDLVVLTDKYPNVPVMCSSSMDFPREYTDDEGVIALCNMIRGNDV